MGVESKTSNFLGAFDCSVCPFLFIIFHDQRRRKGRQTNLVVTKCRTPVRHKTIVKINYSSRKHKNTHLHICKTIKANNVPLPPSATAGSVGIKFIAVQGIQCILCALGESGFRFESILVEQMDGRTDGRTGKFTCQICFFPMLPPKPSEVTKLDGIRIIKSVAPSIAIIIRFCLMSHASCYRAIV